MQIIIKTNAADLYRAYTYVVVGKEMTDYRWYNTLKQIEGMTLTVDTTHLFDDQYNIEPIPGISDICLRIFDYTVSRVIDDVRCGGHDTR